MTPARFAIVAIFIFGAGWFVGYRPIAEAQNTGVPAVAIPRLPIGSAAMWLSMPEGSVEIKMIDDFSVRPLEDGTESLATCGDRDTRCRLVWACGDSFELNIDYVFDSLRTQQTLNCTTNSTLTLTDAELIFLRD